jgi:hypothetical protein
MLGHASIVLTADTYTSVLPDIARQTAEAIAGEILQAGRTPPGCHRPPGLTTASPWPNRTKGEPTRKSLVTERDGLKSRIVRPVSCGTADIDIRS